MATESGSGQGALANFMLRWETYTSLGGAWIQPATVYIQVLWRELRRGNFKVLLRPSIVGQESFAKWWLAASPGFVNFEQGTVVPSLVGNAYGLVLDLGAGSGNQLPRLDASKIKHVYGIESNPAFASALVAKIKETGLEAKYTPVIGCIKTAEAELARYGVIPGTIDCILSIQLLCSVQDITATVQQLHRLLKPGGELIFWEHQRNEVDFVTRMVQGLWNILWTPVAGGCRLNQQTRESLLKAADWEVVDLGADNDPLDLMPRVWGRLRKK